MSQRFLMIDRKLMLITVCPYSGELPKNTVRYFYYLLDAKRDKYISTALRHHLPKFIAEIQHIKSLAISRAIQRRKTDKTYSE